MANPELVETYQSTRTELQRALATYAPRNPHGAIKSAGKQVIGDAVWNAGVVYAKAYFPPPFEEHFAPKKVGDVITLEVEQPKLEDAVPDFDDEMIRQSHEKLAEAFWEARRNAPREVSAASLARARIGKESDSGEGPFLGSVAEVMAVIDAAARATGPDADRVQAFVSADLEIPGQFDLSVELDWEPPGNTPATPPLG